MTGKSRQKSSSDSDIANLRISTALETKAGINENCHTFTGMVPANSKHVMRNPRIVLILWGHFYVTMSDVKANATTLISDLVSGPFMNGLAQYGVGGGSVIGTFVVDIPPPGSDPINLTRENIRDQLIDWINNGTISPGPAVGEQNLVYVIFLPTGSTTTEADGTGGYHSHYKHNANSSDDDLFWAVILTNPTWIDKTSSTKFVKSSSFIVSHELNEAFTDRDDKGFVTDGGCEIGDICETRGTNPCCFTFSYKGWSVEQYWSNWDNNCINGDQPVSVRKFLNVIVVDGSGGLRQLQSNVINVDFVASRM